MSPASAEASPVLVDHRSDGISVITLNRPDRLNASTAAMTYGLIDAFAEADKHPDTNVIVLTGAGRAFCAGGDTNNMGGEPSGWDDVHHRDWHLSHAILSTEKPTIAMVNGAAVGLGLTMALFCDLVFVADDAKVGDTHVTVGLVAGDGAAVTLPLLIGPQRAKALMLAGTLISGAEAERLGLVNRAVPRADLEAVTWETATRIASQPPYAARATKMIVNRYVRWMWQEVMEFALAVEQISVGLPDHKAAIDRYKAGRTATPPPTAPASAGRNVAAD